MKAFQPTDPYFRHIGLGCKSLFQPFSKENPHMLGGPFMISCMVVVETIPNPSR